MTPPDPQQVAEIAGRLSKAQREAIVSAIERRRWDIPFPRKSTLDALVKLGLAERWGMVSGRLLPAGLAVRNFIQGNHHD